MLAEIGCGCIVTEGSVIQNVLVAHVIGDFRPLWSFLRRFADCFMIEDSTVEAESFFSSFMTEEKKREMDLEDASLGVATNKSMNCIWKPSLERSSSKRNEVNGFTHFYMQDELSDASKIELKSRIVESLKIKAEQPYFAANRWELHKIPILKEEGYNSLDCVSPEDIDSRIGQSVQNLANVKKNEFLLQKLFLQEAKHVEVKMANRLKEEIVHEEDEKIKLIRERRRSYTRQVESNKLIQLFLSFLDSQDPCSRVLSIRMLEKELANRGEQELGPLLKTVQMLSTSYYDKLLKAVDVKDLESAKEQLHDVKSNLIESALNIEHFWRELSHLYTDTEKRSPLIQKIPQLAAQHLLDGFCLELLDGDSNLIHLQWVEEVLFQLGKLVKGKRVFVLSVMGVQGSGKSTLLNTMFGIRMRTSVGQCTRGVNMQLLAVEGRPEYDYILLLDTEGTRSPEYHGLAGSEKRDNQMATLSILLSDATIIVIPGENDAAVKEILPIVLMAYQGSQLAEENGGRLSSRIFFVYNRIDTKQKNKLDIIIQTLGTSLHEAFSQVQNMTGNSSNLKSESPFANFNLTSTDSSRSDVCILGKVNKQPTDVPGEKYGDELIQFREHIHQRVTKLEGGQSWKSRSIGEFSNYIKNVWKCICSANFTFTFVTVMEYMEESVLRSGQSRHRRQTS
jgi:GTPase SAR1 family protein